MSYCIVTATEADAQIIDEIIESFDLHDEVEVVEAGGRNFTYSLGRSIVMTEGVPVAVVIDAGTEDEEIMRNTEVSFYDLVTALPGNPPLTLILASPNLTKAQGRSDFIEKLRMFVNSSEETFDRDFSLAPR